MTRRFILGLVLALSCTLPAWAGEVRGRIQSVDLDKNELVLGGLGTGGQPLKVLLESDTQVFFGRTAATLADLPVGRRAHVTFEDRDNRRLAKAIYLAGPLPARRRERTPARADGNTVAGVLQRVARTDREVVVVGPGPKGPDTETLIAVPETARIVRGDKVIALEDLKEGEPVTVQTERRAGQWTARAIQAGPGGAAQMKRPDGDFPRVRMALRIAEFVLQQVERFHKP